MAHQPDETDPKKMQEKLQETLGKYGDDCQLEQELLDCDTMKLLLLQIFEERRDIFQMFSTDKEIMQPQREFDQGLLPGMQYLFQKTLADTDVKGSRILRIKLEACRKMNADPSLKFQEIPSESATRLKSKTTLQILDEELKWWEMDLVCVRKELGNYHYELNWKDFVKEHKPSRGDKIHFYKLSNLENKYGIVIEKAV